MLFSIITGCALTAAAAAADRLAFLSRLPRRFIWLTAIGATTLWPAISVIRTAITPSPDFPAGGPPALVAMHRFTSFGLNTSGWEIPPNWNVGLLVAWALLSSMLMARLAVSIRQIQRRQATWRTAEIDGMGVQLAPDAGPAVLGLHPMRVVLPEWVLDIEGPLRALVLRHEAEHRAARDPYLLFVATLVTALVPWNVALWLQAHRLRLVVEIDCDARVLRAHPSWRQYALLLITIVQRRAGATQRLAPALSEPTSNLERRIAAMRTSPRLSLIQLVSFSVIATASFALACAVDTPESPDRWSQRQSVAQRARPVASSGQSLDPATTTFFEFQVDEPVVLRAIVPPRYPAALKSAGIGGEVSAQYVVDETGRINMRTFKVLKSSDPQFTAAVKEVLPKWRLDPATRQGRKVRQLVQQSFVFGVPRDT
jgi:TonB family protein